MSTSSCCTRGFQWDGKPEGKAITFPLEVDKTTQTYVTGSNTEVAVLLVTDFFGWEYPNIRLLADHFAREAGVTVYVPDFFHGDILHRKPLEEGHLDEVDLPGWSERNRRSVREPEIVEAAMKLRAQYSKVGAVGYCYGGWAVFVLGSHPGLVDCISTGHPSGLTEEDIQNVQAPVQILAPEHDPVFTPEIKEFAWKMLALQRRDVVFEYQHFPGVEHSCFTRGNPKMSGERDAMARGKNAVMGWLREWLHGDS